MSHVARALGNRRFGPVSGRFPLIRLTEQRREPKGFPLPGTRETWVGPIHR